MNFDTRLRDLLLLTFFSTIGLSAKIGLLKEGGRALGPPPQNGNIILHGGFISVDEGSRLERVILGFGAGANKMRTYVEGYLVTATGWKPIGSGEIKAGGGNTPGMILPAVVGIATGEYVWCQP